MAKQEKQTKFVKKTGGDDYGYALASIAFSVIGIFGLSIAFCAIGLLIAIYAGWNKITRITLLAAAIAIFPMASIKLFMYFSGN